MKLLPVHVIAARGLLGMTQADLAKAAGLAPLTIVTFENDQKTPKEDTYVRIQTALEQRGIEFMNGGSPGVRYHPAKAIIPKGS